MAKSKSKRDNPANWCPRCQDRKNAPEPNLALMNPLHESFCRNIAIHKKSRAKAYMDAGYSGTHPGTASGRASLLLKRVEVSSRIEHLMAATVELDMKTREWVDNRLKEIVDRCMQAKAHLTNGKPDGQWFFDATNANKALFSMGKDRGMFGDKLEITNPADAALAGKSTEEVLAVVEAAAIDLGRDFIKRLGEKVGITFEGDSTGVHGATTASERPVPTLQ